MLYIKKDEIPQFYEMFIPILEALKKIEEPAHNKEIDKVVMKLLNVPDYLAFIPHNDTDSRSEFEYRAAWARTYLKKAGYIENPSRSHWQLKSNINIEDVHPEEIIELVRNMASEMTDDLANKDLTRIEAAQAFEKYILRTLESYLNYMGETYINENKKQSCDLYIPNGLKEIPGPLYIEIKYAPSLADIQRFCFHIKKKLDKKDKLLIITNDLKYHKEFEEHLQKLCDINVTIWNKINFSKQIPFPNNLEVLSNPRASIVQEVISEQDDNKLTQENTEKIQSLKEAYKNQELVLFLGAGVSMDAGIPNWNDLINRLLLRMIKTEIAANQTDDSKNITLSDEDIKAINTMAKTNQEDTPLMQMRYIRKAIEDDKYFNAVHEELYADKVNVDTALLNSIAALCKVQKIHKGLKTIVTYNFDDLVEQNLAQNNIDYNVIQSETNFPDANALDIYHVHGYLPQTKKTVPEKTELIFSEEDYHRVYKDSYCWSNMAQVKPLQDKHCLFVGCSLNDPNLRRLLDRTLIGSEPRHFAILKRKSFNVNNMKSATKKAITWYQKFDDRIRNEIFKSLGINVIWVNDYNEIPEILNTVAKTRK